MVFKIFKNYFYIPFILLLQINCTQKEFKNQKTEDTSKAVTETKLLSYHELYLEEIKNLPQKKASQKDTLQMIRINGGEFLMGGISKQARRDEFPRHKEVVTSFWMDKTEVTNRQFAAFIEATGYITTAERKVVIEDKTYQPGSLVFDSNNPTMWWKFEAGANWKHPYGPNSIITGKEEHPVVQVSWYDAMAYAHWAGKRLPKEKEWEYAAKGGSKDQKYFWGNDFNKAKQFVNFFQGDFPIKNEVLDAFEKTAKVGSFPANNFGLFDIAGNVWEWCLDTYYPNAYQMLDKRVDGYFKEYYNSDQQKVVRGGSFLCSESYCTGYRISARMSSTPDSGLEHTGFRCVIDIE